jgi:hypothetical protein
MGGIEGFENTPDALAIKKSNQKRFHITITPLPLKSLSDKGSDNKLGWSPILDIDP